ncbi:MAG: putative Ig domain-containing protein [Pseudomonadales bacterium]
MKRLACVVVIVALSACSGGGGNTAAPDISTSTVPSATIGSSFLAMQVEVAGGKLPLTYVASGLPPGMQVSATGVLDGTPTELGEFSLEIVVTDSKGRSDSQTLALTVSPPEFATVTTRFDGDENGIPEQTAIMTFRNDSGLIVSTENTFDDASSADPYSVLFTHDAAGFLITKEYVDAEGTTIITYVNDASGNVLEERRDNDGDGNLNFIGFKEWSTDGDITRERWDFQADGTFDREFRYTYHAPTFFSTLTRDDELDGINDWTRTYTYPSSTSDRESEVRTVDANGTRVIGVTWQDNPDGTVDRFTQGDEGNDGLVDWVENQTQIRQGLNDPERRVLMSYIERDNNNDGFFDVYVQRTFNDNDERLTQTRDANGDNINESSVVWTYNADGNLTSLVVTNENTGAQTRRTLEYSGWYMGYEPRIAIWNGVIE